MTLPVIENHSLKAHNTLAVEASARYFVEISQLDQIPEAVDLAQRQALPLLLLGQGSNIVFESDYPGLVLHMGLKGIEITEQGDSAELEVAAGENWHDLVMACVARGLGGIENLALIPGTVGAAPIQNIGAYGVELGTVLVSVTGWHRGERCWRTLTQKQCLLAYRDSVFKHDLKDQFIITSVRLRLQRNSIPRIDYQPLNAWFSDRGIERPSLQQVVEAVIAIRRSKLPDPEELPNAGSFFKNPIVTAKQQAALMAVYPDLVSYPLADGQFKLAAAWLIDRAGWKGRGDNGVAMHALQALVLVNQQAVSGRKILAFAERVREDVLQKFGVKLEIEPAIY